MIMRTASVEPVPASPTPTARPSARPRHQVRSVRLAEQVAATLRDRILGGELADGSMLPKQDQLMEEFGISMPPIREALRILESEGLITVRRGNVGGASVHRPQESAAASMFGMLLQSRRVTLGQLVAAMAAVEPMCVVAAAERPDRATAVLPVLRATLDESAAAFDDAERYTGLARRFHTELVATCGNTVMALMVGVLETLWTAHVDRLARRPVQLGAYAEPAARRVSSKEHERIYAAIAAGDARAAERAARTHTGHGRREGWGIDLDQVVDVSALFAGAGR